MKPLRSSDLVRQNLFRKPARTGLLTAVVALFTITLFCGTLIGQSASNGTRLAGERLGADILFVPHGYDKKLQGSLLRGEPSSFYLNGGLVETLRKFPGVAAVSSQLFAASLNADCCTIPVQIIGFDPKTDFTVSPWITESLGNDGKGLSDTEIVVGGKIVGEPGERISLFGKEFTIAAKLEKTGMGFDASVFMDIDRARRLTTLSDIVDLPEGLDKKSFVSSVLVRVADPAAAKETANAVLQAHAVDYNLDFVLVAGMISELSGKLRGLSLMLYGAAGLVWVLAAGVLMPVFSIIAYERKKEFGLLRLMGAGRGALAGLIVREAFLISLAGALIGLGVSLALLIPFDALIAAKLQAPSLWSDRASAIMVAAWALLVAAFTGPLASLHAALKLGRCEAYVAVREEA